MTCHQCDKPALRIGSKGRGYCIEHQEQAWKEMNREATRKDYLNGVMSEEVSLEAHRMHVMKGY